MNVQHYYAHRHLTDAVNKFLQCSKMMKPTAECMAALMELQDATEQSLILFYGDDHATSKQL